MKIDALLTWIPGRLARNSSTLFAWMLLRAAMQAGTVVLLARQLGAQQYGMFVAVIAAASFITPFVGLGLSHLVLRNAARDPIHEALYLARAVSWWTRTLVPGAAVSIAIAMVLLPAGLPIAATCAVITAELGATSLTELCARHHQAKQQIHAVGATNAGLSGIRLLAFGLLFFLPNELGIVAIFWAYAASSLIYLLILWVSLPRIEHRNSSLPEPMTARDGLPFSMAAFAMKLQSEFNKPMLAQVGFGLAGTYNVAQRALDISSLPLLALQEALWPRLYSQQDPMRQLRRTGGALMAVALVLGTGMWLAAPLLPYALGEGFADAVWVLRILAWLPFLQVFRALMNFHAIHHARMKLIGWAYTAGAIVGVVTTAILIPMYGMHGAVIACYVSELSMIAYLGAGAIRAAQ